MTTEQQKKLYESEPEKKVCTNCNQLKCTTNFSNDKKNEDGLNNYCKDCRKIKSDIYNRTKEGVVSKIYSKQKDKSKSRGHIQPNYSKDELQTWIFSHRLFHELFKQWEESNYSTNLKPSIDRIDDSYGYSLDNIQLMSWQDNRTKSHQDIKNGKLEHGNKPRKAVTQMTLDGEIIAEYISVKDASRKTNIPSSTISLVCNGKQNKAGGFKWKFLA